MAFHSATKEMDSLHLSEENNNPQDLLSSLNDDTKVFQKEAGELTVVDVYSIAASIGHEIEKLTEEYGGSIFLEVMPKMIKVLELLESFASKTQNFSTDVVELQAKIRMMQMEERSRAEKQKEEIEIVQAAWRDEAKQLYVSIEALQKDNEKLTHLLTEKLEAQDRLKMVGNQEDAMMKAITEKIGKQRDELRGKERLLENQSKEVDALSAQVERLARLNATLHRKVATVACQSNELEMQCREKDRQVKDLQNRIIEQRKEESTPAEGTESSTSVDAATSNTPDGWPGDPLLAHKLVIDLRDPDRPQYTKKELAEVLTDRNNLKLKCFVLQEELNYYKEHEEQWELLEEPELPNQDAASEVNNNKQESGIRKLLSFLHRQ